MLRPVVPAESGAPRSKFFFLSSARGIFPRSLLLSWAGERSRAGSSCPSNRETQQETPLAAAVRGSSTRAGTRRIKVKSKECTVRSCPGVRRLIGAKPPTPPPLNSTQLQLQAAWSMGFTSSQQIQIFLY